MDVIHVSYDSFLVCASYLIAIAASYTVISLLNRITIRNGKFSQSRLFLSAFSMGIGIWSMHFVGMLAFKINIHYEYNHALTLLSLIVAIITSICAIYICLRKKFNKTGLISGGILLGLGISAMHYTGMAAMHMQVTMIYDPIYVAASILISIIASISALSLVLGLSLTQINKSKLARYKISGAVILGTAICGMHYTGMAAVTYHPSPNTVINDQIIHSLTSGNNIWLAIAAIISTILILVLAQSTILYEYQHGTGKNIGSRIHNIINAQYTSLKSQKNHSDDNQISK